jgi:hypothetical protein
MQGIFYKTIKIDSNNDYQFKPKMNNIDFINFSINKKRSKRYYKTK